MCLGSQYLIDSGIILSFCSISSFGVTTETLVTLVIDIVELSTSIQTSSSGCKWVNLSKKKLRLKLCQFNPILLRDTSIEHLYLGLLPWTSRLVYSQQSQTQVSKEKNRCMVIILLYYSLKWVYFQRLAAEVINNIRISSSNSIIL